MMETYTLLLVVVGFLQFFVLAATVAILYFQTRLTEHSLQQWVEIGNWAVEKDVEKEGSIHRVSCTFEISNKSERPIILRRVVTDIAPMRVAASIDPKPLSTKQATYEVTENLMLPPQTKAGYTCLVPVNLDEEDFARFLVSDLFVFFSGRIYIRNPRGGQTPQWFQQLTLLGPKKVILYQRRGAVPEKLPDGEFADRS